MDELEKFIKAHRAELDTFDSTNKPELESNDPLEMFLFKYGNNLEQFSDETSNRVWKGVEKHLNDGTSLETWVSENRQLLDVKEPSAAIWERIENNLPVSATSQPVMVPLYRVWQVAAAVVFVLISSFSAYYFLSNQPDNYNGLASKNLDQLLEKMAPELTEAELYYQVVINEKLESIKEYDEDLSERIRKDFFKELSLLDQAYDEMKPEVIESQHNEQVISAMIYNLQLRIDLLNKQLDLLQRIENKTDNDSHEEYNL